jgi:magnesium chelatase subunit D
VEEAAGFVLPHRMRKPPEEETNKVQEPGNTEPDSADNEQESPDQPEPENNFSGSEENTDPDEPGEIANKEEELPNNLAPEEETAPVDRNFILPPILLDLGQDKRLRRGSGKRSLTRTDTKQGRYVRARIAREKIADLAFDATLRAAAPYQRQRDKQGFAIRLETRDLREKVREKRIGSTFLFVVDASASMGVKERMRAVKGAIFAMLQEAYQKRDKVGLIVFRRDRAETLLPVTRSVDLAQKLLSQMPTGGRTPLREGLDAALLSLSLLSKKDKSEEPVLVLITDGRANTTGGSPQETVQGALHTAAKIGNAKITSVVIDTETDFIKLGIAKNIAQKMNASYYKLNQISQENVLRIVKNTVNLS